MLLMRIRTGTRIKQFTLMRIRTRILVQAVLPQFLDPDLCCQCGSGSQKSNMKADPCGSGSKMSNINADPCGSWSKMSISKQQSGPCVCGSTDSNFNVPLSPQNSSINRYHIYKGRLSALYVKPATANVFQNSYNQSASDPVWCMIPFQTSENLKSAQRWNF
jgi:hypothetical protein